MVNYFILALCVFLGVIGVLYLVKKRQVTAIRALLLEKTNEIARLKKALERIKQREEIEQSTVSLTDSELDERLQNDFRD